MTTAFKLVKEGNTVKMTPLHDKTQKWCKRIAGISLRRAFKVKTYQHVLADLQAKGGADFFTFYPLPKAYRGRVSLTDGEGNIFLHSEFFDNKGCIQKKLDKALRTELKAAIYKEVAHHTPKTKRPNVEFYKMMMRCSWVGPRVDGAKGSKTEARTVLREKREQKKAKKQTVNEVPTGVKEEVQFLDLTSGEHVTVMADIFLANGNLKIARAEFAGRKLRKMLKGAEQLKKQLQLG